MALLTVQNLLLALIVIVPGFLAVFVAVSLGVVRRDISRWHLLIISLTASVFVDTLYFGSIQYLGFIISSPNQFGSIFFTPIFRPGFVLVLLGLSVAVGVVAAVLLAKNIHIKIRRKIWDRFGVNRHRKFHEPWEGTLDDAEWVHVLTSDGSYVNGRLRQYSDDGKEKQLAIAEPQWWFEGDEGEWRETDADVELLFGDDIKHVSASFTTGTGKEPDIIDELPNEPEGQD